MPDTKRVLVVEDELTNAILLKRILVRGGFIVHAVNNGLEAKEELEQQQYDVILTDWMMPLMDGIELIRFIRESIKPNPLIIMITALVSDSARNYALDSGADDFITKPIDVDEIVATVNEGLARINQSTIPDMNKTNGISNFKGVPPFPAVAVTSSTGGPPTLIEVFKNIDPSTKAAFFIVQHGPIWMLETFSQRLAKETNFQVKLGANFMVPEVGVVYIAPGDKHMVIDPATYKIVLEDGPKENFVRPAADPLFRSVANAFGRYSVGVVLSGLGKDGSQGITYISKVKGSILIQDPETAIAPSMPLAAINTNVFYRKLSPQEIGKTISEVIFPLAAAIKIKS
ncbi:MAG TPA: chemotaxis protein CheB [Candidatus Kapabacteria bacterium]|nr:chemotaxis protein CheB [Candidatus Kapabacteria bacterium]